MADEITRGFLVSKLRYDPETGLFWWLTARGKWPDAKPAGQRDGYGYTRIWIAGKKRRAHQLAWLAASGEWPDKQIDHINGDPSDNRLCNLRLATRTENHQNRGRQSNNSTGYTGVYLRKTGQYTAEITHRRKKHYLGVFDSREDAFRAYLAAKAKLHTFQPVPRDMVVEAAR